MFEFLTRQICPRENSVEKTETLLVEEVEPMNNMNDQMVENFLKKSAYRGKSLLSFSQKLLSLFASEKEISQGVFFITDMKEGNPVLRLLSGFAYQNPGDSEEILEFGEGFPGQVAQDGKIINLTDIPEGYMTIESGLGKSSPVSLIIFPIKHNEKVMAVIELASFHRFTSDDEQFFEEISPAIAEQLLKCISKS